MPLLTAETPSRSKKLRSSLRSWLSCVGMGSLANNDQEAFNGSNSLLNIVPDPSLEPGALPARTVQPVTGTFCMSDLVYQAIRRFAGAGNDDAVPPENEPKLRALPPTIKVSLNPTNSIKKDLTARGYTNTHVFLALPSVKSLRWLFPLENKRCTLGGLQIYMPYAKGGRILKGLLTTLVAARCQGFAPHRVLVASRGTIPLEALVREITGEHHPVFSLSVGIESPFRKLTVQVMRPDGEILGYIKLPLTEAAVQRVRHEAETLNRLWSFPALRSHIPRVLYSGEWGDGAILFQSGGPPRRGPAPFNRQCEEFLLLLRGLRTTEKPGAVMWEEVAARWRKAEPSLGHRWRALGEAALAESRRELEGLMVPYCIAHGDFVPWNTRMGDGRLYVFDWESASWEAPALWDTYHFKTQVGAVLKGKSDLQFSSDGGSVERASFLLYLLNSACRPFGEDRPAKGAFLEYRRQMLAKELGRI